MGGRGARVSAFDELTLGELRLLRTEAFGGAKLDDESVDALELAGGVMWLHRRRTGDQVAWVQFMNETPVAAIKAWSEDNGMTEGGEGGAGADPTDGRHPPTPSS